MSPRFPRTLLMCGLLTLLLGSGAGCNRQDAERLERVGRTTAGSLSKLAGGPHGALATSLDAMRGAWGRSTIDSRVATRLEWDKDLASLDLHVTVTGKGVVRLEGKVNNDRQRRRAVSLAASTLGVDQVDDALSLQEADAGK